ncbi:MAG: twin-arginine translocase TatA/TatE family subunit [Candidatus Limnocylindria bacterium]
MFGIGAGELLLLLVLALFVLGPERMPRLARDIGKTVGDLRRTSDELKQEFLNADALIDRTARLGEPEPPATPAAVAAVPERAAETTTEETSGDAGATQAEVGTAHADTGDPPADTGAAPAETATAQTEPVEPEPEPEETAFDREARLARARLEDPARAERAKAEGWTVPSDEAGTNTDRWS